MEEGKAQALGVDDKLFYDAFRASPIGIALEDLQGRPLFVNPALCSILGFSEEELLNKRCVDFSPPEDARKDWALFQQLKAGSINHYSLDKRYFRRDGSLMWGRLNISLMNHRANPLVIATLEDITEIRAAKEEQFRYAAIVESSEDAIISVNLDHVVLNWNVAAQHMFGYTEAEVVGRPLTFLAPPEKQHEEIEIFQKLKAGERVEHYETIRVTKAGKRIHVSLSVSPIKDSTGRMIGASKIVRDITQQKLAVEALSRMSQRLIEAQEQERSRLARELHDDINQRLAMVMIRLGGLKENPPGSADQLKTFVGKVIEEIADLGQDVQALSHRLHSPRLELLGLAAAASSFCKEFSNRHHVEIDFESTNVPKNLEEPISLCLYRVLQEALQNAAKHSGSRQFQVSLTGGTEEIKLTVSDSGVGFELNEVLERCGLGLISMKERLKLVNGELSIDSQPRHGTTIQARVPLTQQNSG